MKSDNSLTYKNTQVAKGLAIIIIVICHIFANVFPNNIARLATPLGGIGVCTFLFLSGYGINESYKLKGLHSFWKKKILRIFTPYILCFGLYIYFTNNIYSTKEMFMLFFTIKDAQDYYYWYIGYQIFCYIAFFISVRYCALKKIKYGVLVFFALVSFFFFNGIRGEQSFSFLFGVLCSDLPTFKRVLFQRKVFYLMIILGSVALGIKQIPLVRQIDIIIFTIIQICIKLPYSIVLINLSDKIICLKEKVSFLGKYSYEIYLSHSIAILFFCYLGSKTDALFLFVASTVLLTGILDSINRYINCIRKG